MIFTKDNNNRIIKINLEHDDFDSFLSQDNPYFDGLPCIHMNTSGYGSNTDASNFIDLTYCQEICNSTERLDDIVIFNLNTQDCQNTIKLTNFKQNVKFVSCNLINAKMWDENIASNQEIVNHNVFYTEYDDNDFRFYNCILPANCYLIFTNYTIDTGGIDLNTSIRMNIADNHQSFINSNTTALLNYSSGEKRIWTKVNL